MPYTLKVGGAVIVYVTLNGASVTPNYGYLKSSDPQVISVDPAASKILGAKVGKATLTYSDPSGAVGSLDVFVQ